jgi:FKBP-type peptidyl-prolyl cis-trans isomerase FkpA
MKQKLVLVLSVVFITLLSCDKFKTKTTATGEKIQIHTEGKSGKKAKDGDLITFNLEIKTDKDSLLKSSYKEGAPYTIPLQKGAFKGSFENALYHIGEGDSTTVFVNADSLYKLMGTPPPPFITKGSDLKFIVKINKIQSKADFDKEIANKKAAEPKNISDYVSKNLVGASPTADGIYIKVINPGTGPAMPSGKTAVVQYVGKFLDGKIFDQSDAQRGPFEFVVGSQQVIPGWDKVLLTMKKGEKVTCVIPSALAYGEQGGGPIPPNSPLVFDITLVDIK